MFYKSRVYGHFQPPPNPMLNHCKHRAESSLSLQLPQAYSFAVCITIRDERTQMGKKWKCIKCEHVLSICTCSCVFSLLLVTYACLIRICLRVVYEHILKCLLAHKAPHQIMLIYSNPAFLLMDKNTLGNIAGASMAKWSNITECWKECP